MPVATAAALLGAKSFGGGKVCSPPGDGRPEDADGWGEEAARRNVDKMAKPTEDTQIKDSRTGKVMSLPSGVC